VRWLAPSVLLLVAADPAAAHELAAAPVVPGWTWDPAITLPLTLVLAIYLAGWWRLRERAHANGARDRQLGLFLAGWLVIAAALVSPLHQLGERSFTAHMIEHELLMLIGAPLIVLARPLATMLWAFPRGGRQGLGSLARWTPIAAAWRFLGRPLAATLLQAAALWLWHLPGLFGRALGSDGWHIVQHLCFVLSGLLFWHAMLSRSTPRAIAVLCLFATSLVAGALGALMAFSVSPWYARYAALGLDPLGLTPVEDQQVAGLLMWVPGGLIHAGAALMMIHLMLREGESRGKVEGAGEGRAYAR
jgi:putative membrane protein